MLHQKPARPGRPSLGVALCLALAGCGAPDPKSEVEMLNLETYWAIDSPSGTTQYLAPVVRFELRNQGNEGPAKLADEAARVLLMPEGVGRYTSTGAPEGMFQHPQWKDVSAEVFLRVDNSTWTKFGTFPIERHIGSKGLAP